MECCFMCTNRAIITRSIVELIDFLVQKKKLVELRCNYYILVKIDKSSTIDSRFALYQYVFCHFQATAIITFPTPPILQIGRLIQVCNESYRVVQKKNK